LKTSFGISAAYHPQFGAGKLLRSYIGGLEWEVLFDLGAAFPAARGLIRG
jgi:hypothetical protein